MLNVESLLVKDALRLGMTVPPAPSSVAAIPRLGVSPAALEVPKRLEDSLAYLRASDSVISVDKNDQISLGNQAVTRVFRIHAV